MLEESAMVERFQETSKFRIANKGPRTVLMKDCP